MNTRSIVVTALSSYPGYFSIVTVPLLRLFKYGCGIELTFRKLSAFLFYAAGGIDAPSSQDLSVLQVELKSAS